MLFIYYINITAIITSIIFLVLIYQHLKHKNSLFYGRYISFLNNCFYILAMKKLIICKNDSMISCIKYNEHRINNVYYFISKKIRFNYKLLPLPIVKSHPYIVYSGVISYIKNYTISNLKLFGFKEVILSQDGSLHSECWHITTVGGCGCNNLKKASVNKSLYYKYDRVISISHYWGNAVFHSIGECLTKLGYYIPELLKDKSIYIHTYKSASVKYLIFLGFNSSRILYGNIYANRVLTLEKGGCGSAPPIIYLHSLRFFFRNKISSHHIYDIVLIRRYGKRDIINFYAVYSSLEKRYRNKKIIIFYPNTTFKDTLNYFKYAKLIVAPHGAGLTNMILSDNCKVIEFVCGNMCYCGLARQLGLEYYGILENLNNNMFKVNITLFEMLLSKIEI